jgi:SAM-dependent methyltransferase
MDLKETDILGDGVATHWYYRSKAAATRKLIGDRPVSAILDVGSGSAFFSRDLLRATSAREAWCVDISYDADSDDAEAGKPVHLRRAIGKVDANVVLLMDVLEHVDDDVGLLAEYAAKVPSGSTVLISVPAFRFMWSGHDDYLEHKRRYTLAQVEAMVGRAGLAIERSVYYFGLVFPLAMLVRMSGKLIHGNDSPARSQLSRQGAIANTILTTACSVELPLMPINRLAGLTVFCVAKTP